MKLALATLVLVLSLALTAFAHGSCWIQVIGNITYINCSDGHGGWCINQYTGQYCSYH